MPSTQTVERPMIVEGRTIRTIEEMREFCAVTRPDGRKVFDVSVSSAG